MKTIVQKYGGSSLSNFELIKNVANRISEAHDRFGRVVCTVSAMGDSTDELLAAAGELSPSPDRRELDVLLSTGELRSCALVAISLNQMGKKAISLSGYQAGITTTSIHGNARISDFDSSRINQELSQGNIVVVAGFQGATEEMDVTTLGRGASDLTAVVLAAGLGADKCEIYSDVDGIYTADPRLVPEAIKLDCIGFEEMLELASYGAKMNPRSIELGMVYDVPILVASSIGNGSGTLIDKGENMNSKVGEIRNRVVGVATDADVAKITIHSVIDRPGIAASIFEPLSKSGISVDVIVQNASVSGLTDLTFTVKAGDLTSSIEVVESLACELGTSEVDKAEGLAKVSIVGTGMQDSPGYAAKMFSALSEENINIDMITTSEIRITCIINEYSIAAAARALHRAFDLGNVS